MIVMTMNEVINKIHGYDEKFETINGTWVIQKFSTPWAYTEYEFTADQQKLINILEYDIEAENPVVEKSVD